jgi:hypothetical protein
MTVEDLVKTFAKTNSPASEAKEASRFISTNDILNEMESFSGEEISKDKLVETLEDAGYKYEFIEDSFMWLIA